jgi:hypothetical protein
LADSYGYEDDELPEDVRRKSMAATLRGKPMSAGELQAAGLLFSLGQNPVASQFGQEALQAAHAQPRMALEGQQLQRGAMDLAQANRRNQALGDPASPLNQFRGGLVKQFGGSLPEGMSTQDITDQEFGLLERAQAAKQRGEVMRSIHSTGGGMEEIYTPASIALLGEQAHALGALPKVGAGAQGSWLRAQIANYVSKKYPDDNLALNGAVYKANAADMEEGQKLAGATDVNEAKALGDMEVYKKTVAPLFNSNSQWLNATVRELQANAGNVDAAKAMAARTALVNGINKVLAAGNLSDSSRKEANELLHEGGSISQLNGVLDVLTQDMARSKAATHQRVSNAMGRISGKAAPEEATAAQGGGAAAGPDHDAAATWLRDPASKSSQFYARNLAAYKKAHGGAEP